MKFDGCPVPPFHSAVRRPNLVEASRNRILTKSSFPVIAKEGNPIRYIKIAVKHPEWCHRLRECIPAASEFGLAGSSRLIIFIEQFRLPLRTINIFFVRPQPQQVRAIDRLEHDRESRAWQKIQHVRAGTAENAASGVGRLYFFFRQKVHFPFLLFSEFTIPGQLVPGNGTNGPQRFGMIRPRKFRCPHHR